MPTKIIKKPINMKKLFIYFFLFVFAGCIYVPRTNQDDAITQGNKFKGKVEIGMTQQQVAEQWGEPDRILKKQGKDFDEIWIYIPHWKFKNFLYFRNGVLIRGDPNPEDLI